MLSAIATRNKEDFPIPNKIISMDVDKISGYAAHDGYPSKTAYFIEGTQPKTQDPIHVKIKVCKGKNELAAPQDIAEGNYEEKEFIKLYEDCPGCQKGIDEWIASQGDKDKYNIPTNYCRSDGMITVDFETPGNEQTVGGEFDIKIKTSSVNKVVEAKFWVNGDLKNTWTEKPFETKLKLNDGVYTLKTEVKDINGKTDSEVIKIGVNMPWNGTLPTMTPTAGPTATPTILPTNTPILTPTVTVIPSGT